MLEKEPRVEIPEKHLLRMSPPIHFELFVLSAAEMCDVGTLMYKEDEVGARCN